MAQDVECERCNGKGELVCDRCGGAGSLPGFATWGGGFTSCDVCYGSGYITCPECNGDGYIEKDDEWDDDDNDDGEDDEEDDNGSVFNESNNSPLPITGEHSVIHTNMDRTYTINNKKYLFTNQGFRREHNGNIYRFSYEKSMELIKNVEAVMTGETDIEYPEAQATIHNNITTESNRDMSKKSKEVYVSVSQICPLCEGYGGFDGGCPKCNGTGFSDKMVKCDISDHNKDGFNILGYDKDGYDEEGYDRFGYDRKGYDTSGHDRNGYNEDGYDIFDWNKENKHKDTLTYYNKEGYDRDGYDKNGFNIHGYDKDGYSKSGWSKDNKHKDTLTYYDREGYNRKGYDKDGYDRNGYDDEGYTYSEKYQKYGHLIGKKFDYNNHQYFLKPNGFTKQHLPSPTYSFKSSIEKIRLGKAVQLFL